MPRTPTRIMVFGQLSQNLQHCGIIGVYELHRKANGVFILRIANASGTIFLTPFHNYGTPSSGHGSLSVRDNMMLVSATFFLDGEAATHLANSEECLSTISFRSIYCKCLSVDPSILSETEYPMHKYHLANVSVL